MYYYKSQQTWEYILVKKENNMFGYKVYINLILYKIGLKHILPSAIINQKQIKENGEKLVKYDDFFVRESVANMLRNAIKLLPEGYSFKILCGYRSQQEQQRNWENGIKTLIKQHPTSSISEIENLNRKMNADPRNGFGPHQTGGAIDITLLYKGKPVDMGGKYMSDINSKTYSKNITNIQKSNRKILINSLKTVGFQNYPNEWWHWSFGDRAYAAYKNKPFAVYGKI